MKRRIRVHGFLIFLALVLIILLSGVIFPRWKKESLDEFFDTSGIVLVLLGFLFRISARGHKEEKTAGGVILVKDGPYSIIRNPMYFGTLMIGTGIILVLFKPWALIIFLLFFMFIYIPQIKKEEAMLSQRFGEKYHEYKRKAPAFLPYPRSLLEIRKRVSLKLSWIKKELFSLIAVLLIILVIETWQDVRAFGYHELQEEFLELGIIIIFFITAVYLLLDKTAGKQSKAIHK